MPRQQGHIFILFLCFLVLMLVFGCKQNDPFSSSGSNAKIEKLKLPAGFMAEHLYSPGEAEQGSWVSMTFDDKGRMITSDQYGALYRLELPAVGDTSKPKVEKLIIGSEADLNADTTTLKIGMGYAQGLLYAFNSLYVMVNHNSDKNFDKNTGMYRIQDTNGDDQFDKITLIKSLDGEPGEHGPHSIILSPDKKSIYISVGNHIDMPEMETYRLPRNWQEDNLFPQIKDPRGHANNRTPPGGWIAKMDSTGNHWELVSAGYRNEFDLTFNEQGDLFTYDSDMEWDFGMPWYRPTRICHVTSGSEYGWRTGNGKWSPSYPDNLPPVINIGQGSPTNFISGLNSNFPPTYKKALFAFDWSFGIIYALHLTPMGSSYSAEAEEFLSGSPLPLTDGAFGPDGALYFLTGGRRLESDLYRISVINRNQNSQETDLLEELTDANKLRRNIEQYHEANKEAVDFVWPHLNDEDRFVRYAARIAIEHQALSEWQERALSERDPQTLIESMIALARTGKPQIQSRMVQSLVQLDYENLTVTQQIELCRAIELLISRMGMPVKEDIAKLTAFLDPHFPSGSNELDRLLSKILVHIGAPTAVEKSVGLLVNAKDDPIEKTVSNSSDLIMRNPQYGLDIAKMLSKTPPAQQTYLATVLSEAQKGWTSELYEEYFTWFAEAFSYKGGLSYIGFIDKARKKALAHVSTNKRAHYNSISGDALLAESGNELADVPQRKSSNKRLSDDEILTMFDQTALAKRNFDQGKMMYAVALCSSCHAMQGEGSNIGTDLSQLGRRFTAKEIVIHTIHPNKEISDQYAATVFSMKDGGSVVGRLINEEADKYYISQNPFAPQALREIAKNEVLSTKHSTVSLMLPGLINRLSEEEIKDLIAFLVAGGNPNHEVFN